MISNNQTDGHSHRGERLENPPEGYKSGFPELLWNLREYGYPISLESVKYVHECLETRKLSADDADYKIVAQWIDQHKDIEFDTNNYSGEKQLEFTHF